MVAEATATFHLTVTGLVMNLVRHDLTLSAKGKRFPLKGTYLAIYSATVNPRRTLAEVLQATFPCAANGKRKGLFLAYVEAKQAARW